MHKVYTLFLSITFVLLWSSGWVGSKFGLDYSGPFTFLTIRYLLVVIILSLIVAFLSTAKQLSIISRQEFSEHALVGVLSHGVYLSASIAAMSYGVTAGMVAFIAAMQPILTTLCSGITGDKAEGASRLQWAGMLLGALAVYVTLASDVALDGFISLPYLLLFVSVAGISVATLLDRRITLRRSKRGLKPGHLIQVLWIHSLSALLFFACAGFFLEGFKATWNLEYILTLAYMAGVVSIVSYGLMYLLLRRTTAINVSSLIYLTPPSTMLLAWPILGETVTLGGLIGLLIGAVAVVMVLINGKFLGAEKSAAT